MKAFDHHRDALRRHNVIGARECCRFCRQLMALCFCDHIPKLGIRTRLIVFMQRSEYAKSTNSGFLAARCLEGASLCFRGHITQPQVEKNRFDPQSAYVLYPENNALLLTPEFVSTLEKPITLICPDGHWGQARKIIHHEPSLQHLPRLRLPDGLTTHYRLRRHPVAGRVCTMEAIAMALGILEGSDIQKAMEVTLERMVTRMLYTRGRLSPDEVLW